MNREIKFRGKQSFDNKWIHGSLLKDKEKYYITNDYGDTFYAVIPQTIGQYTGLKDENDKELYEGDVIDIEYKDITVKNAIITYKRASFYGLDDDHYWKLDCCSIKKIGNIYESKVKDDKDN